MQSVVFLPGIVFLNLFRGSTSSYQWRCSPLDKEKNKLDVPNFRGSTQAKSYTWEHSQDGSYIYRVNGRTLNCSGTVTAVEFCYFPSTNNTCRKVFTLLILIANQGNLITVRSIPVYHSGKCNMSKCCDIMPLQTKDQIDKTMQTFYIVMQSEEESKLAGLHTSLYPEFTTTQAYLVSNLHLPVSRSNLQGSMNDQTLRLMWFHITPFSTTNLPTDPTINSLSVIGGIIGSVIVLIVVIVTVVFSLVLYMLYRRRKLKPSVNGRAITINNIYNNRGRTTHEDSTPIKPEYDYSDIGPSTGANKEWAKPTCTNVQKYEAVQVATGNKSSQPDNAEYDDYTVPADNVVGLYEQLDTLVTDNVTRYNIHLGSRLGSGQFGDVYKGVWERRHDSVDVAVKTLKEDSSESDKVKFLQEAAIMAQFRHHNVVTMYGLVKDGEPVLLILEMLDKGDLRNYLLSMKTADDGGVSPEIDGHELLSYCRQVASGMVYLSNKAFVHRDLAARNILVSDDRICKIADFGMSRDLADESYYVSQGGLIPVKWTAPEALFYKKYSTASDVWSFGAVMYEIWSMGHKPFENVQNSEVIKMITAGYRLPPPPGCPRAIYSIMMSCWHPEASGRPSFNDLSTRLSVSNSKLLHPEKSEFSAGSRLGADLPCGEMLYSDLQKMYKKKQQ